MSIRPLLFHVGPFPTSYTDTRWFLINHIQALLNDQITDQAEICPPTLGRLPYISLPGQEPELIAMHDGGSWVTAFSGTEYPATDLDPDALPGPGDEDTTDIITIALAWVACMNEAHGYWADALVGWLFTCGHQPATIRAILERANVAALVWL